jgi:hypothetical protein
MNVHLHHPEHDVMKNGFGLLVVAFAAGLTSTAQVAAAQLPVPLSVEVRADAAFPRGGPFEELAGFAVGVGANAAIQLVPNYALYVGYSRTSFPLEGATNARAIDSGVAVGLTRAFPVPGTVYAPWIATGLLLHRLEVERVPTASGENRPGFEVGGGVAITVAPLIRLTPGLSFRRYEAPLLQNARERISYFGAGVGLNVAF